MNRTVFDDLYEIKVGNNKLGDYANLFPIISMFLIMSCCCVLITYLMITCGGGE